MQNAFMKKKKKKEKRKNTCTCSLSMYNNQSYVSCIYLNTFLKCRMCKKQREKTTVHIQTDKKQTRPPHCYSFRRSLFYQRLIYAYGYAVFMYGFFIETSMWCTCNLSSMIIIWLKINRSLAPQIYNSVRSRGPFPYTIFKIFASFTFQYRSVFFFFFFFLSYWNSSCLCVVVDRQFTNQAK